MGWHGARLKHPVPAISLPCVTLEAAVRGVRQAQAEDVTLVDIDQLEKVLPQLVCGYGSIHGGCSGLGNSARPLTLGTLFPHSSWTSRSIHPSQEASIPLQAAVDPVACRVWARSIPTLRPSPNMVL